jgi:hypothetical protein
MAATFKDIIVNVVDDSGKALANAAVTQLGGTSPQVLQTDASGNCTFKEVPPGNYRLIIASEGFNTRLHTVTHSATADSNVKINMKVVDEDSPSAKRSTFFTVLTGLQYIFMAGLAFVFALLLYKGFNTPGLDLSKTESARGMITFVVSVVTVAIALILVVGAAFMSGSKDLDKRFAFGKEVFTVLVGVLGTVMGFYYGQAAATGGPNPPGQAGQTIQIAAAQVTPPSPKVGTEFTLTANITGGEKPYTYSVTFSNPAAIVGNPVVNQQSDGTISHKFTVASDPALADKPVGFTIQVKDSKGTNILFDKGTFTPTK